jgi:hypothetical protein
LESSVSVTGGRTGCCMGASLIMVFPNHELLMKRAQV